MYFTTTGNIKSTNSVDDAWKQMNSVFGLGPDGRGSIPQYSISRDPMVEPDVGVSMDALSTAGPSRKISVSEYSEKAKSFQVEVSGADGRPSRKYRVQIRDNSDQSTIELQIKQRFAPFPQVILQSLTIPFARQMLVNPILHRLSNRETS